MVQEGVTWFSNQQVPTEDQIVGIGGKVGFIQGANSATIFVPWSVGGNSGVTYYLDLYAIGPKGTKP